LEIFESGLSGDLPEFAKSDQGDRNSYMFLEIQGVGKCPREVLQEMCPRGVKYNSL